VERPGGEHTAVRERQQPGRRPCPVEPAMTLSAPALRRTPRPVRDVVPALPRGHPGCYWNWDRAAWVAWTPVPRPRPPQ
jgi:hypothetical protein